MQADLRAPRRARSMRMFVIATATLLAAAMARPARAEPFACEYFQDPITKVGPYAYVVERGHFEELWRDAGRTISGARPVLAHRGESVTGIRLLDVKPWSFVRALGFRSGDVLTTIDGQPIDRLEQFQALAKPLQSSATIRLGFLRRGLPRTFTYTLR